jgi:hypothetical protein
MIKKNITLVLLLTLCLGMLQNNFTPKALAAQADQQSQASEEEDEEEQEKPSIWKSFVKPLITTQIENFKTNSDSYVVGRGVELIKENVKSEGGRFLGLLKGFTFSISKGGVNTRSKAEPVTGSKEDKTLSKNVIKYNALTTKINNLAAKNDLIERSLLPELRSKKSNAEGILNEKTKNSELKKIGKRVKALENELTINGSLIKKLALEQSTFGQKIGLRV